MDDVDKGIVLKQKFLKELKI